MENPILHTKNLSIGYRKKGQETLVCPNVEITLEAGKLTSLVGANGIGKSTLLRTITGLQPALSGSVIIGEKKLSEYSQAGLARTMSLVLTEKLPPSRLSVFELVATARQPYTNWIGKLSADDITAVNSALEMTGISHLSARKHFEISDGQLQNALVARALAQETPLIILDEPMTHLDFSHKAELFALLRRLASETKKAILFSTHDIDMAIQLSDDMIVMTQGKIRQDTPANFMADGSFDALFPKGNIAFDRENRRFVFRDLP